MLVSHGTLGESCPCGARRLSRVRVCDDFHWRVSNGMTEEECSERLGNNVNNQNLRKGQSAKRLFFRDPESIIGIVICRKDLWCGRTMITNVEIIAVTTAVRRLYRRCTMGSSICTLGLKPATDTLRAGCCSRQSREGSWNKCAAGHARGTAPAFEG
ncbi:hypothetical protein K461DRAFT_14808 [Myriangium duriaei CBS 260.36]|uniref:Uncharacterized protein n=1 Tax=Myriangium duriaei CBS 260.36 TaxID=1168546 RepID=A0A9P4J8I9_9PEZI|nr:hypothetical protein K461DRAFT_14808 [Myriangium duriaei CBS 260.36]